MLEAKNLTIKYPGSKFNSLNVKFQNLSRRHFAIQSVGCGKTTLAKSLGRTIEIPEGQLFLDEIDIKDIKLGDLRKNIAIVPQEAFLFTSQFQKTYVLETQSIKRLNQRNAIKAALIEDINSFSKV